MPKGVPACGFRKYKSGKVAYIGAAKSSNNVVTLPRTSLHVVETVPTETDVEIEARIAERFEILETLTGACIDGIARSLLISGPAGVGKSHTVMTTLQKWDPEENNHIIIKGYVRALGLYKALYNHRHAGKVLVFDDADTIFNDETALNILKAVCDTTERRTVSWLSEYKIVDEDGEILPRHFDFEGTVIFISNLDFDDIIEKNGKLAPHLSALMSRSHYINCGLKTKHDYFLRIQQVIQSGMLGNLDWHQRSEVIAFIKDNKNNLRELSLRMAIKLGGLIKTYDKNWMRVAKITCCK